MLILRRHWVAGGKCDVTLTPALVDIYKKANEQSVSSFTITTEQSGTIIAESLTNSNNVPYFTINRNTFSPGTTTVTVTGIAFEEGYPTNIGRIIIKCRGGGKQIIDVDYADCSLDVSIDNLIFDDDHGTVTFDITSTAGGTINTSHLRKISKGSGEPKLIYVHASGSNTLVPAGQTVQVEQLTVVFNTQEERDEAYADYTAGIAGDPGIVESSISVTTGQNQYSANGIVYYIYVNGSATNNGSTDAYAYAVLNAQYHSSTETETIRVPAVGISPKTFNAGTTTITATIDEEASAGDLGYLVISNSCGATTNVNVSFTNSGGNSGSGDDEEYGVFLYLTKSKTIPNSETPDSDYYHYPDEIPSYVNEHIYTLQNGHGLLDDGTYLATHYNIYVWMGGDLTDAGMSNAVLAFYYNHKDWLDYYDFYKDK